MKQPSLLFFSLLALVALVAAWGPEDHEIFRIRDELMAGEGEDVTFYDFLGASPSATLDEINKAYRKKSRTLHPDKAVPSLLAKRSKIPKTSPKDKNKKPGVRVQKGPTQKERAKVSKEANERYARVGIVANILRGPQRDRYDHFLKNGFPRWRGTGYYYARFRPGLGSVLAGLLLVFGGAAHYGALYIGWRRQREFVQRYVSHARRMAWGNESGIPGVPGGAAGVTTASDYMQGQDATDSDGPGALNRREKRAQEKESKKSAKAVRSARANGISRPVDAQITSGPQGSKKKVIAENGKVLIVDSAGNVFLEEETEEGDKHEFLLDPEEIPRPTISQTALVRLPLFIYAQTLGRVFTAKAHALGAGEGTDEPLLDPDGEQKLQINISGEGLEEEVIDSATAQNANQESRKRKAKAKR